MNKKIYLLPLLLLVLIFTTTSCEETEEAGKYDNWRARNEAYLDSIQTTGVESVVSLTNPPVKIYYKKLKGAGEGSSPTYTGSVTAFYRVKLINGDILGQNFTGESPSEFDAPVTYVVSNFLSSDGTAGYTDILQYMKKGERWEVYIPYEVGYGTSDHTNNIMGGGTISSCPGYSLLIFDVELIDVED